MLSMKRKSSFRKIYSLIIIVAMLCSSMLTFGRAMASAATINLVDSTGSHVVIVKDSGTENDKAANDLADYFKKVTNQTVSVKSVSEVTSGMSNITTLIAIGSPSQNSIINSLAGTIGIPTKDTEYKIMYISNAYLGYNVIALTGMDPAATNPKGFGASYATYDFAERFLGVKFFAPDHEFIPLNATVSIDTATNIYKKPAFEWIGFDIHGVHSPYAGTELLKSDKAEMDRYIDWLVKVRQNVLVWTMHDSWSSPIGPYSNNIKSMVAYAHSRGIAVGAYVGMYVTQQGHFSIAKNYSTGAKDNSQIPVHLDQLLSTSGFNLDVLWCQHLTTEFSTPDYNTVMSDMTTARNYIQTNYPDVKFMGVTHIDHSNAENDPNTPQLPSSWWSEYFPNSQGLLIHTVGLGGIDDRSAGQKWFHYNGNDDLEHTRILTDGNTREVWYWPETAFYCGTDVDHGISMPSYIKARWYDLQYLKQHNAPVKGNITFTTGFNWEYWMNDYAVAKYNWAELTDFTNNIYYQNILNEFGSIFGAASTNIKDSLDLLATTQQENSWYETGGGHWMTPIYGDPGPSSTGRQNIKNDSAAAYLKAQQAETQVVMPATATPDVWNWLLGEYLDSVEADFADAVNLLNGSPGFATRKLDVAGHRYANPFYPIYTSNWWEGAPYNSMSQWYGTNYNDTDPTTGTVVRIKADCTVSSDSVTVPWTFVEGDTGISGASLILKNVETGTSYTQNISGSSGTTTFSNIQSGSYLLQLKGTTNGVLKTILMRGPLLKVGLNENLALGETVTATSSYESTDWAMAKVLDGQNSSVVGSKGWSSNNNLTANHTESVTVDLGTAYSINNVNLYPRNDTGAVGQGFPIDFTIKVSTDNTNWTTVVTKTGYAMPSDSVQSFTINNVNARYIKVEGTNLRQNPNDFNNYRMQFAEIQAFGEDLALNKTITASSSYGSTEWAMAKVVDGQRSSVAGSCGWTSNDSLTSNHTEWVQVDLGSSKTVSKVKLYPRNDGANTGYGFPIDFTIKVSTDNTNWTTVVTKTGYALPGSSVQSFTFSSTNARYIKVEGTNLRQNPNDFNYYRMQFAEIEVY